MTRVLCKSTDYSLKSTRFVLPVQLTTSRVGSLTPAINDGHTYTCLASYSLE